jgi:nitrite reductase/ring-hydroxylating ferredoxin subunit
VKLDVEAPALGDLVPFELGGHRFLLTRMADGLRAFPRSCPHEMADLLQSGYVEGRGITCGDHNYCFDLNTGESDPYEMGLAMTLFVVDETPEGLVLNLG